MIPAHVQQRDLRHDGTEQVGTHRQHVAGEQPAVAASHHAQLSGRGNCAPDQVFRHRDEVLVCAQPVRLERGLVPGRTELAAATYVGDNVDAALFQPHGAHPRRVLRCHRDLEAAVAVEQGGTRTGGFGIAHQEVGNSRAVFGGRPLLGDGKAARVEHGGHAFQDGARSADGPER